MNLKDFAKATNQTVQEAFNMCCECEALYTEYADIMVNLDKVNDKLDKEIIEELEVIG